MNQTIPYLWFYKGLYDLRPAYCGTILKRLLRLKRRVVPFSRGTFFIDPCSHFGLTLLREGAYEDELTAIFEANLRPGGVFVDVGANEGYFSVVASKLVGATGRVVTVEPQSRLRPVLDRNMALNGAQNISLNQVAISNGNGSVDLYLAPDTITGSTSLSKTRKYPVPRETVKMITLLQLLETNQVKVADLMKMDVEGYEYEAILGSQEVFRSKRVRTLVLELHSWILRDRGLNPDEITGFLQSAGYSITVFDKFVLARAVTTSDPA
jgi:FkbM family methyltransferase